MVGGGPCEIFENQRSLGLKKRLGITGLEDQEINFL